MSATTIAWSLAGWLFGEGNRSRPDASRRRRDDAPEATELGVGHTPHTQAVQDAELIARLREGDVAAFTVVFRTHYASLVRAVTPYVETRDIAEDVVQDTFTMLWERRHTFEVSHSLKGYLFINARNRALNMAKRAKVLQRYVAAAIVPSNDRSETGPHAPSADQATLLNELTHLVATQVATLSPRQQEIFHLSRNEGLSPQDIAAALGIAPATVYVQLGRIAAKLFPRLEPWLR